MNHIQRKDFDQMKLASNMLYKLYIMLLVIIFKWKTTLKSAKQDQKSLM